MFRQDLGGQGESKGASILGFLLRMLGQVLLCLPHIVTSSLAVLAGATEQMDLPLIPDPLEPSFSFIRDGGCENDRFHTILMGSRYRPLPGPCRLQAPTSHTRHQPNRNCSISPHYCACSKLHNKLFNDYIYHRTHIHNTYTCMYIHILRSLS